MNTRDMEIDMALRLQEVRMRILERTRSLQRAIELSLPAEIVRHVRGQIENYRYAEELLVEEGVQS